ncbi:MAG TPA: hypothetical protein VK652_11270 [Steroidobacteraceae bacterium]|nr:hypothetical protein [Steroidobacteraceae bacterium]
MFVDRAFDAAFSIRRRIVEIGFETAGDVDARIIEPAKEELFDVVVVKPNPKLTIQLAGHLDDLGGVAHLPILQTERLTKLRCGHKACVHRRADVKVVRARQGTHHHGLKAGVPHQPLRHGGETHCQEFLQHFEDSGAAANTRTVGDMPHRPS